MDVLKRSDNRFDLVYPPQLDADSDVKLSPEEYILDVQGYVVERDLPPITRQDQ